MLLVFVGLTALLGVALTSAVVAARSIDPALQNMDSIPSPNDWLSPGPRPDTSDRGEPRGSQGTDADRLETGGARTPASEDQPAAAGPREDSRSSRREVTTATRPTPTNPPRRDRRNPSAGWARLSHHCGHQLHGRPCRATGATTSITPPPSRSADREGFSWEDEQEQWTWG